MRIVKASKSHIRHLVDIGKQHWFYENWITAKYLQSTLSKDGFHYTAIEGNEVLGGIMAVEEDYPKFWLYFLAVNKNHQRKGIGTTLLRSVESRFKKGNWIFVDLEKRDRSGISFYLKNGFKAMGTVNN